MIRPGTQVVFHDHAENYPCNERCYVHTDTAPITLSKPLRYFVRSYGHTVEVWPLTKPSRDNGGTVLVEVRNTGRLLRVREDEILRA